MEESLGSYGSREGFEGSRLDWGMARVGPTVKCNTSDCPKRGQVPTPLNEFCLKRHHLFAISHRQSDAGTSFHTLRHWHSLCQLFHLSIPTFIFRHSFFTSFLNSHRKLRLHGSLMGWGIVFTWFMGVYGSSFARLEGVC